MACDAATIEALQVLNRETGLSQRDLLMARASLLASAAGYPTATDAVNAAYRAGLSKVCERDLEALYTALICNLT